MSKGSIITLLALVVGLLGGMFVWKSVQRSQAESEASAGPVGVLSSTKVYKDHRDYVDGLLREAHPIAFAQAYKSGGLFAPSEWDEQKYLELVFEFVGDRARKDGKDEVAEGLPAIFQKEPGHKEAVFLGGGATDPN